MPQNGQYISEIDKTYESYVQYKIFYKAWVAVH